MGEELEGALIIHSILEVQPAGPRAMQRLLACTHCALKSMLHLSCSCAATSHLSPQLKTCVALDACLSTPIHACAKLNITLVICV